MKPASRIGTVLCALAVLLLLAGSGQARSGSRVSGKVDASKPFVVKIHADWCGTCTRIGPAFKELEKRVGAEARIVVLDVSDRTSTRTAYAEAKRLELLDFFNENKNRTGTVGVLRGDTREVVELLRGETDLEKYLAALDEARGSS